MARKHQGEILADAKARAGSRTMGAQLAEKLDELGLELPELTTIERPSVEPVEVPTVQQLVDDGLTDTERLIVEAVTVAPVSAPPSTPAAKAQARILKPCKRNHDLKHWRITPKQVPYCDLCYKGLRISQAEKRAEKVKAEIAPTISADAIEELSADAPNEIDLSLTQ